MNKHDRLELKAVIKAVAGLDAVLTVRNIETQLYCLRTIRHREVAKIDEMTPGYRGNRHGQKFVSDLAKLQVAITNFEMSLLTTDDEKIQRAIRIGVLALKPLLTATPNPKPTVISKSRKTL